MLVDNEEGDESPLPVGQVTAGIGLASLEVAGRPLEQTLYPPLLEHIWQCCHLFEQFAVGVIGDSVDWDNVFPLVLAILEEGIECFAS